MDLDASVGDSTARSLITKFTGDRANQPDMSEDQAGAYLRERVRTQPKLMAAMDQDPCVRRAYAIFDQGRFHGTPRHEGGVTDLDHERRVLLREDPAQPDPEKRAQGLDGHRKGKHIVGDTSSSISDPVAYMVALVRGVENPDVRSVLESPFRPNRRPDSVMISISDLLGPNGHEHCGGYRLVGDDLKQAADERNEWIKARRNGDPTGALSPPRAVPVATFEGGEIEFRFTANRARTGYELITMFPQPPDRRAQGE